MHKNIEKNVCEQCHLYAIDIFSKVLHNYSSLNKNHLAFCQGFANKLVLRIFFVATSCLFTVVAYLNVHN